MINRYKIETEFKKLLTKTQPSESLVTLFKQMFKDAWSMHVGIAEDRVKAFAKEAKALEKQIAGLVERIMDTKNQTVITAHEKKIDQLEKSA